MELFNDTNKAYFCAVRRFFRQKSDEPVYIYRATVARREMWAVLSAAEATANKVPLKNCYTAIDGKYGLLDAKKHRQKQMEEHPDYPYLIQYAKGVRQQLRAQEKLAKMGRDDKSVERSHEVRSCSDQQADPSY